MWDVYGFPLLLIAACILTALSVAGRPGASTTDFLTFYQSGRQYLAGADPYVPYVAYRGPNLNPPWVVALLAQLCRATLVTAVSLWWAISFACFFWAMVLIGRTTAGHGVTIACAVLVTQAAYSNVRLGQVAWPLMLLVTAAWLADRRRRSIACGVLLGAAMSWKPFLLIFAPYLIWRRAWGTLAAIAITVAATVAVGFALVGASGYASWLASLLLVGWEGHPLNASLRGVVTRILTPSVLAELHTTPLVVAPAWRDGVWLAVSLLLAAATVLRIVVKHDLDMAWGALGLLAVLISPLGWVHYVPIAIGPIAAVLMRLTHPPRLAIAGWLLLCVPFAWLKIFTFGPVLTLTVASAYAWGALALLAAVLLSDSTSSQTPNALSATV